MLKLIDGEMVINDKQNRLFDNKKDILTFEVALSRYNGKLFAIIKSNKKLLISETSKYIGSDSEQDINELRDAIIFNLSIKLLDLLLSKDVVISEEQNKNLKKQINKACNSKIL